MLAAKLRSHFGLTREGISRFQAQRLAKSFALPSVDLNEVVKSQNLKVNAPIKDFICLPPFYFEAHDDFSPLMQIAMSLQPRQILELGTAHGNSTANLCRHCPDAEIVTVNAPAAEQSGKFTTFSLSTVEIGSVYRQYGFQHRVNQILCNTLTLDLSKHLENSSVDLAIIDACHDSDYVINDFYKVLPYVKVDGYVLFHDTHPSMRGHLLGSYLACMRLRKAGFDIKHVQNTWWGIWRHCDLNA